MRRDRLFLAEMIDAASTAVALCSERSVDDVANDRVVRDALQWNFTVLGEAATKVSEETRAAHPEVPWRLAGGLRNRIVHGYWSIDIDVLFTTATQRYLRRWSP